MDKIGRWIFGLLGSARAVFQALGWLTLAALLLAVLIALRVAL